ncbi:MAG: hypothetical protein H6835_11635 [Planctomycetes bacterium]|nr:hypothetical protein [Planctomycetota bacterium]
MSHRLAAPLSLLTTLAPFAAAQDTAAPAAQQPPAPLARYSFGGVPQLAAQLPASRFGRLLADEEVAPTVDAAVGWFVARSAARLAVRDAVLERDVEIEPYYVSYLITDGSLMDLGRYPLSEMQHIDALAYVSTDEQTMRPSSLLSVRCRPQFDGRWLRAFEESARRMERSRYFTRDPEAKIDGFPAAVFKLDAPEESEFGFPMSQQDPWQMHMPGTYAFGTGRLPQRLDELTPTTPAHPGLLLEVDLQQYLGMFSRGGMGMILPAPLQAFGTESLRRFTWNLRFEGERVLDEIALELGGPPEGVLGALLTGTAALPKQPLPDGAMAQIRAAIDLPALSTAVQQMLAGEVELPEAIVTDVEKALSGGLALGVAAPAPGGVIPRVFASLGLADREAFDRLLAFATEQGLPIKEVEYEGVACHRLELPGMPNGLQITFGVVGDTLHFAESGRSMRSLLKALADGGEAMDLGEATAPSGPGDALVSFDLRFDEVEIYRAYRDVWLPLYVLASAEAAQRQPVKPDDLPDVETFARYCGKGRGVLRRDGERFALQQSGTFGGLEALALTLLWPTMIAGEDSDWTTQQLSMVLARHELRQAWDALEVFHKREQRWPRDLGELFAAQKLADDALLLPGDAPSEELSLADGRKIRSSFRYFAEPVQVEHEGEHGGKVLLIELAPRNYGRVMLTVEGELPDVYGEQSSWPIDRFGK